jgi:hypothetical protein
MGSGIAASGYYYFPYLTRVKNIVNNAKILAINIPVM